MSRADDRTVPSCAATDLAAARGHGLARTQSILAGLVTLAALLLTTLPGMAQDAPPPPLWLIARADSVLIHIAEPPAAHYGFVVYRGPIGGELIRITPEPVIPESQPALAAALLGDDLPRAMAMLDTDDPVTLLRRMQADPFNAAVTSALFRGAAVALGRFHADAGLAPGQAFAYRIVFVDAAGEETAQAMTGTVVLHDVQPGVASALVAEPGNYEVELTWQYPIYTGDPLDVVLAFHVYRGEGDGGEFQRITDLPMMRAAGGTTRFLDRSVLNGEAYRYHVRALDLAGRLGEPARAVAVTPFDPRPPAEPGLLVTEAGEARVALSWRISPESSVIGYHVERSTGLDQPYERITPEPVPLLEPSWVDTTVVGAVQYFYRVVAVTSSGVESRPTNPISALPYDETPPEPPADLVVESQDRQLRIRWTPSPSDDVLGYYVYRGDSPDAAVRLTSAPVEATEFLDLGFQGGGLNPGRRYTVRVSAVDRSFNESEPVEIVALIPDDEAPDSPTAVQVDNIQGRHIELSWSASPALDVEQYLVIRSAGTAPPLQIAAVPATAPLAARDTLGLVRGVTYGYQIVAVDTAGNRSEPAEAGITFRDFTPPPAPRHTAASAMAGGGIQVTWERVVDPELAGYRVYRSLLPNGVYEAVSELIPAGAPLAFTDAGGTPEHYFTVRAVDRSGNESRPGPAVRSAP
jgi:fibronectin type 3 domain-containing protein